MVSEARINESVSRLLREKFALKLFENPYVNAIEAEKIVGSTVEVYSILLLPQLK